MNDTATTPTNSEIMAELRALRVLVESRLSADASTAGKPWTLAKAAKHLDRSESWLRKWIRAGAIPAMKHGRSVMLADEVVQRLSREGLPAACVS
jgi:Helix-turn-helix domain